MTRIKAHNPAKVVTGGDSSRSLPTGGGGGGGTDPETKVIRVTEDTAATPTLTIAAGVKRIEWRMEGKLGTRNSNSTPTLLFGFKTGKTHTLMDTRFIGAWRGAIHNGWDYGNSKIAVGGDHYYSDNFISDVEVALGYYNGGNHDPGTNCPFVIDMVIYAIKNYTFLAGTMRCVRRTQDAMCDYVFEYGWNFPMDDINTLNIWCRGNTYSAHEKITTS